MLAALLLALAPDLRTLEPGLMQEDLFTLMEGLHRDHAGLFRYSTPGEIEDAFGEALFAVEEELTAVDFYRVVTAFLAQVRCGHTNAALPDADLEAVLARRGVLPIEVHLYGDRAFVARELVDLEGVEPGDELLAVDGLPYAEIRARVFRHLSSDGFNETNKERELELRFGRSYAVFVDDLSKAPRPYAIQVAGRDEPVLAPGLSADEVDRLTKRGEPHPVVDLELRDDGFAVLSVEAFGDPAEGPSFPELLESSFEKAASAKGLILDLRGNGGGRDQYGALLVSYFAKEPFGYFDHIEVTADYEGGGGIVEKDGKRLVTEHPGLSVQQPAEHRFAGDTVVLIDGWTFSTAADVATVLHHNHLATFVGEETGGGYDGNTSGRSRRLVLESSHVSVSIPQWMYTTANVGHAFPGHGVPPDHAVRPTVEDRLAGRDVALDTAVGLLTGG